MGRLPLTAPVSATTTLAFPATQATSAQINLQPLADYGAPTQTMALGAGSVAIDKGNDGAAPATDQRGVTRPQGAHSDVGAYEVESTQTGPNFGRDASRLTLTAACAARHTAVCAKHSPTPKRWAVRRPSPSLPRLGGRRSPGERLGKHGHFPNDLHSDGFRQHHDSRSNHCARHHPGGRSECTTTALLRRERRDADPGKSSPLSGGQALTPGSTNGGSIWSFGSLIVENCTFTGNTASSDGGAIESFGGTPLLTIDNSTFSGNSATGSGSAY